MVTKSFRTPEEEPDFGDSDHVSDDAGRLAADAYLTAEAYKDHLNSPYMGGSGLEGPDGPVKVSYMQDDAIEDATAVGHDIDFGGKHYPAKAPE